MLPELTIEEWLEHMSTKFLTIGDITDLSANQSLKILCIDHNFMDICKGRHQKLGKSTPAVDFVQKNYIINYIHLHDLTGLVSWNYDNFKEYSCFNFHLNYKQEYWSPLDGEGYLPDTDFQGFFNLDQVEKDYRQYPLNTKIGWRGPMIKWTDVIESPNIISFATYSTISY